MTNFKQILNGKNISLQIQEEQTEIVKGLLSQNIVIQLDVVLLGLNPASLMYIKMKQAYCEQLGINFQLHKVDSKEELESKVLNLNNDNSVRGFFVQLPLSNELKEQSQQIVDLISPTKDVDGLTSSNLGKVLTNAQNSILPGTVRGIIYLLNATTKSFEGKNVTIINNSILIGKPLGMYLSNHGATVTICNEYTVNLYTHTINADILITATGVAHLIKENMVKKDAILIDAGINIKDGKTFGDIDFEQVKDIVSYITPVPGGVGPLTIACLIQNLIDLYTLNVNNTK